MIAGVKLAVIVVGAIISTVHVVCDAPQPDRIAPARVLIISLLVLR